MRTEIIEDGIDLHIGLLEAEPIQSGGAYPFPTLISTGLEETRRFRTVILENSYLRAVIVPALGGRILTLFDKRTGTDILPVSTALRPRAEGRRGVRIAEGIQLRLDGEDRLNALGNVAVQFEEAEEDDMPAGVWLGESAMARGLGFHLLISMPADRAEIRFEARIHNRTFSPLPYDGELALFCGDGEWSGNQFYNLGRDAGFALFSDQTFDGARFEDGTVRWARFGRDMSLAPRQVDSWSVTLVPYSGLGGLSGASRDGGAFMSDDVLRIQGAQLGLGHKALLYTRSGETLEAPLDLYPENVTQISLAGLPSAPAQLVLLNPAREEILAIRPSPTPVEPPVVVFENAGPYPSLSDTPKQLDRASLSVATRFLASTMRGIQHLGALDYESADAAFEQALLFNGDDPLLWWAKAVTRRQIDPDGESAEKLNAHYLAPLEPALRAEAFLGQTPTSERAPSPLLEALTENVEEFVEVACLLIEHRLLKDAARWLDESLRHRDLAMLRLLYAYCLLEGTHLRAEAAEHVAAAKRVAGAPYPWRGVEVQALRELVRQFPGDTFLAELLSLAEGCAPGA